MKCIVHIYYGTSNNAGLYIKKIVDGLESADFDVIAFVNYYFLFNSEKYKKRFFKHSENIENYTSLIRKVIKYSELFFNFQQVYREILRICRDYEKVYINYSLNEDYRISYRFLKKIQKLENVIVGITVHDIIAFNNNYPKIVMVNKNKFFSLGDFFVVHNDYSYNILSTKLPEKKDYIFKHKFPLMDLRILQKNRLNANTKSSGISFLFIGYLRREKGLQILLEAWRLIQNSYTDITLTVVGRISSDCQYDFSGLKNFQLIDKFVNDDEYVMYIDESDYVVLPYLEGTNSGILSTVSSLRKPSITSNLQMFMESEFSIEKLRFDQNSTESLCEKLGEVIVNHQKEYKTYCNELDIMIEKYENLFRKELTSEYRKITVL